MLVLESEADYDRYQIPRNALSDVLVVGPDGVGLAHRGAPVLMAASPREPVAEPARKKAKGSRSIEARDVRASRGGEPAANRVIAAPDRDGDRLGDAEDGKAEMDAAKEDVARVEAARPADAAPMGGRAAAAAAPPPPAAPLASRRSLAAASRERADREATSSTAIDAMALEQRIAVPRGAASARQAEAKSDGPAPLTGELAEITAALSSRRIDQALSAAWAWRRRDRGDVLALIGLGESLEAKGDRAQAARAYGSIIDLFPARADLRRFAGQRLERLGADARALVLDTYRRAVTDRPDHLTGYRLLAFALVRAGNLPEAFKTLERGLAQEYPSGRFPGGDRILREDAGLVAAAWLAKEPGRRSELQARLRALRASLATAPSTRFVLYWETDANDVDFHIRDARGGHAFYSAMNLPSGGSLYQDVTTGYGPECFTIPGVADAGPYRLSINYYSQGPMGYGMGLLEVLVHDGKGGLSFDERPFVVMQPGAFVELGSIPGKGSAVIAQ